MAQLVEHVLGKDEVTRSNRVSSSTKISFLVIWGMIFLYYFINLSVKSKSVVYFSKYKKKGLDAVNIIAFLYKTPFGVLDTDKSIDAFGASCGRMSFRSW